jgi:hypothetical protein
MLGGICSDPPPCPKSMKGHTWAPIGAWAILENTKTVLENYKEHREQGLRRED